MMTRKEYQARDQDILNDENEKTLLYDDDKVNSDFSNAPHDENDRIINWDSLNSESAPTQYDDNFIDDSNKVKTPLKTISRTMVDTPENRKKVDEIYQSLNSASAIENLGRDANFSWKGVCINYRGSEIDWLKSRCDFEWINICRLNTSDDERAHFIKYAFSFFCVNY